MAELVSNVVLRPHWSSLLKLGSLFMGPNTHFLCPCVTWANWPIVIRHICYVRNTQFLLECCYLEFEKELEWKNLTESSNGIAFDDLLVVSMSKFFFFLFPYHLYPFFFTPFNICYIKDMAVPIYYIIRCLIVDNQLKKELK